MDWLPERTYPPRKDGGFRAVTATVSRSKFDIDSQAYGPRFRVVAASKERPSRTIDWPRSADRANADESVAIGSETSAAEPLKQDVIELLKIVKHCVMGP